MAKQELLWTALPNGVTEDGSPRVSVLLSPRLHAQNSPQVLETFPPFLDWPATLRECEFTLFFSGGNVSVKGSTFSGATRVDDSTALAGSEVWQAMLPPDTHVEGFTFEDMSKKTIVSYPASNMASFQRNLYLAMARRDDDELPEIATLLADPGWQDLIAGVDALERQYGGPEGDNAGLARDIIRQFDDLEKDQLPSWFSPLQRDLLRFELFHTPAGIPFKQTYMDSDPNTELTQAKWQSFRKAALPDAKALATRYDFHQIVSAMNQSPTLLRLMGLVIDFIVEPGLWSPAQAEPLRVEVSLPGGPVRSASVPVLCDLTRDSFTASTSAQAKHHTRIENGLLDISLEHFDLIQQDVDGTGIKAMNLARTLARQKQDKVRLDPTTRTERRSGLPAMRNAGLTLVQRQRGNDLSNRFGHSLTLNTEITSQLAANNPGPVTPLYAEDVVRGYRFDIWDDVSKRWHSLCRRNATYTIDGLPPVVVNDEEGISRLAATRSAEPGYNDGLLWLHESVVAWSGWSLCAPMPGKVVGRDQDNHVDHQAETVPGIPLSSTFVAAPGTLPRLRYGRHYWIRARAVDLAGNSLPPGERDLGNENPEKQAQAYLRYEPVKAPAVTLCENGITPGPEEPLEGESVLRMAIRTFNDTPDLNLIPTTDTTHRAVLPERSSVKDAEVHGLFDKGGVVSPASYPVLAAKDADLPSVDIDSIPAPLAPPQAPVGSTTYTFYPEGSALPYLPDPVCLELAARFFGHPNIPDSMILPIRLYASGGTINWPDALPFRIRLLEDPGKQPVFMEEERILYVPLPKGYRAKLRLSVKLTPEHLDLMGLWHWLSEAERDKLRARALNGQHWMLTPWREVELVHAVQRPLISPDAEINIVRYKGKTWAVPVLTSPVSIKSTEHVALMGEWHEPDVDADGLPMDRERLDRAFTVKITPRSQYRGTPDHQILKPDLIRAGSVGSPAVADKMHEFNDTRYRRITYWLDATSRFREYMPAPLLTEDTPGGKALTDKHLTISGIPQVRWIPNAAPPPAPQVSYAVPTYAWHKTRAAGGEKSWRRGGGLRLYLDGPWYASGYGEMLAVVLPGDAMASLDPNVTPGSQPLKEFVTQWGNDPIWETPFIDGPAPDLQDFPLARTKPEPLGDWLPDYVPSAEADQPPGDFTIKGLTHPQMKGSLVINTLQPVTRTTYTQLQEQLKRVNIAPHDVAWDSESKRWYCDIELSPGATYYPFVRLAVARYQPVSVQGCHLSNIVLTDFMTLPNDRLVSVARQDALKLSINVSGPSYTDSSGHKEALQAPYSTLATPGGTKVQAPAKVAARTIVEVTVEKLDPALGEDFGWSKDTQAVVTKDGDRQSALPDLPLSARTRTAPSITSRSSARDLTFTETAGVEETLQPPVSAFAMPLLWKGQVTLAKGSTSDGIKRRLVVAEYEEYLTDDNQPYNPTPETKARRLVYLDHIPLA